MKKLENIEISDRYTLIDIKYYEKGVSFWICQCNTS